MNPYRPIFVVGCQRSGTTLLRVMLNKHSKISIPEESHFVSNIVNNFKDVSYDYKLSLDDKNRLFDVILSVPRFLTWNIKQEQLKSIIFSEDNTTIPDVINSIFNFKTGNGDDVMWGDKTPEYTMCVDDIHKFFPSALFIHIVRDGRDVADSFKMRKWYGWSIFQRAKHWMNYTQAAIDFGNKINKDQFINIRYEDLVLETEKTLKKICDFLQISYEENMLTYMDDVEKNITDVEKESKVHKKLKRLPKKSDVYKWHGSWSKLSLFKFESVAYKNLNKFGYCVNYNHSSLFSNIFGYLLSVWGHVISLMYNIYHGLGVKIDTNDKYKKKLKKVIYK